MEKIVTDILVTSLKKAIIFKYVLFVYELWYRVCQNLGSTKSTGGRARWLKRQDNEKSRMHVYANSVRHDMHTRSINIPPLNAR